LQRKSWGRSCTVVCFLLDNSLASDGELSRRKCTTFRTWRKFEIKSCTVLILMKRHSQFSPSAV
jgi:hypothetical protein